MDAMKICKNHGEVKVNTQGRCRVCAREASKAWNKANPEKVRANDRKRQKTEKRRAHDRKRYAENPEKRSAGPRKWRAENAEKHVALSMKWMKDHPAEYRAIQQNRRARVVGNGGTYTASEWKLLIDCLGNKCFDCGRDDVRLTVGHAVPVCKGGRSSIDNLIPQCMPCNLKQGKKIHPSFV